MFQCLPNYLTFYALLTLDVYQVYEVYKYTLDTLLALDVYQTSKVYKYTFNTQYTEWTVRFSVNFWNRQLYTFDLRRISDI